MRKQLLQFWVAALRSWTQSTKLKTNSEKSTVLAMKVRPHSLKLRKNKSKKKKKLMRCRSSSSSELSRHRSESTRIWKFRRRY